jgi:catechol 2,3-dioxygenase
MQQFDRKHHNNKEMPDFTISPGAKIGYISLNVSDIQKSLEFYQSTLGFSKMQQQSVGRVLLSGNGTSSPSSSHLLELVQASQLDPNVSNSRNAGLYHFAILLPERKNLADLLLYLSDKQDKVRFDGLADHQIQ